MSTHTPEPISRADAERLLAGDPASGPGGLAAGMPASTRSLSVLLVAAAAVPVRLGELPGEEAAVAAFCAARHRSVPKPGRIAMLKAALAKFVTVKIAAIALAATGAVGVAVAATTDTLPTVGDKAPKKESSAVKESGRPSEAPVNQGRQNAKTATDSKPSPSPSLVGLCHAYTNGAGDNSGKSLENPAFSALIAAAAGTNNVPAFCTTLLSQSKADQAKAQENNGLLHPTGKAESHRTGAPETHPTGRPETAPSRPANPGK